MFLLDAFEYEYSTMLCLEALMTINDLMKAYDAGLQINSAILDFSKTFNTVHDKKLISKTGQK
jgi:hypothetical protein